MPKTIGQFLEALAKKAGVTFTEEQTTFINGGELTRINMPEDIERSLDNNLLSVQDAKNNHPDIKGHYTKAALDGVDSVLNELIKDLPDEDKAELAGERSSYKRIQSTATKLRALEAKKAGAAAPDKKAIQDQIDALHNQLAAEKQSRQDLEKAHANSIKQMKVDAKLESILAGYKTIYDTLPPEVRNMTLKNLLQKELQDKDADYTIDENGKFLLLKKDGSNFYGENHQQVDPVQFAEQTFSRHKLLQVTPKPGEKPNPANPPSGEGGGEKKNAMLGSLAKQALAAFEGQPGN